MNDQTDSQLLNAWASTRSEPAFAELVRRHVDLVHSAALRMVSGSHLAEDVTQRVFVALAKSAAQITDCGVLAGWLHRTAQNIAAETVRTDVRRRAREQEAATMNTLLAESGTGDSPAWEHIAPHLDAALTELSEPDQDAVLLRYFERKSAREMAQILGMSEDAAQRRVSRAVERLREFFAKRGVTVGASGLVVVISANAVQAAPVGLAVTISTAVALAGTTAATTATAIAVKTIAMTTAQKTVVGATLAVALGAGIYQTSVISDLNEQNRTIRQERVPLAEQIQQLSQALSDATNQITTLRYENERLNANTTELLRLRAETARLRRELHDLRAQAALIEKQNAPKHYTVAHENWSDVGAATPEAALQSLAWALSQDKFDRARELIQWVEEGQATEGDRWSQQTTTLRSVLSPAINDIQSFKVLSLSSNDHPNELIVKIEKTLKTNAVPIPITMKLRREGMQWRAVANLAYDMNTNGSGSVSMVLPFTGGF